MSAVDGHGDHRAIRDGILFGKSNFWLGHVAEWPIQSDVLEKRGVAAALTKAAERTRRSL
jgi:hypothetical protein